MLNNEFRFIGTVVSDYEKIGSENFPKYQLKIEVERRKKGAPSQFNVVVYEKNYTIDITKSVKGKQVIATGYIDEYKGHIDLILQDMIIVGAVPVEKPTEVAALSMEEIVEVAEAKEEPVKETNEVAVSDDDLPF